MSTDTSATESRHTEDDQLVESSSEDFRHARPLDVDPEWFKRAVFYEVLVRAFSDSNRDGTGDLRGLTEKLDYLQWLGVDCLWLPPSRSLGAATSEGSRTAFGRSLLVTESAAPSRRPRSADRGLVNTRGQEDPGRPSTGRSRLCSYRCSRDR